MLALTALAVAFVTRFVLERVSLDGLVLNLILRNRDPYLGMPLADAVAVAMGRSLVLIVLATALATLLGFLLAILHFAARHWPVRAIAWSLGTIAVSLPSFFWAMLLQLVVVLVYLRTQRLIAPVSGGFGLDAHLLLPAIALGLRPSAYIFRTTATALDEARHLPHVTTALAKGLGPSAIASRHVARNAAPAVLAGLALGAKTSLSSLAIVEYVFTWNGAGYGFILSVANGNVAFAASIALVFALSLSLLGLAIGVSTRALQATAR
jgi:peptide/nickel transport system permease protein